MATNKTIDCTGLACPQPVIQTKEALEAVQPGNELLVIVDNEGSSSNVQRFAESQGHTVSFEKKGDNYHIDIIKGDVSSSKSEPEIVCDTTQKQNIVVHVGSEFMGSGDDELGRILMSAYFETLMHFANKISHITLVNSGVKLAVEGSPVLEHIKELEQMGIEVLSCGTCLNHFGIKEKLAVGQVSNMFTILEAQSKAATIVSP